MRQRARQQLSAFIEKKRRTRRRAVRATSLELGSPDPQHHFTPARHGLSEAQCRLANALLRRAEQERPLRGDPQQVQFRHALRCGGILSAVRNHRIGSSRFGHHLMGYRGGRVMQRHGMHILREIAPIGHLASLIAHEYRQAAQYFETTGEVLPIGKEPTQTLEAQHIQALNDAWEEQQWQQQRDRLAW